MTKITEKMTKKDKFNAIIEILVDAEDASDLIDFCEAEIAALDKKSAKAKAAAAEKKAEADPLADAVLAALTDEFQVIADVTDAIDPALGATAAKVGYRLRALVADGKAVDTQIKVTRPDGSKPNLKAYKLA